MFSVKSRQNYVAPKKNKKNVTSSYSLNLNYVAPSNKSTHSIMKVEYKLNLDYVALTAY